MIVHEDVTDIFCVGLIQGDAIRCMLYLFKYEIKSDFPHVEVKSGHTHIKTCLTNSSLGIDQSNAVH